MFRRHQYQIHCYSPVASDDKPMENENIVEDQPEICDKKSKKKHKCDEEKEQSHEDKSHKKKEKETQEKVALYIIIMKDMIKCQLIMLSCIVYRQLHCRSGDESEGDNDKKDHGKAETPQSTPVSEIQGIPT